MLVGGEGGDRWVGIGLSPQALVVSPFARHKLRPLSSKPNQADLQVLQELVEAGKLAPILDKTSPLSDVPDAIRSLHAGRARQARDRSIQRIRHFARCCRTHNPRATSVGPAPAVGSATA